MTLTANGKQVYEAFFSHTIRGAWTASIQVDSGILSEGQKVTIKDGAAQWVGTIVRGGDHGGRGLFSVVGGAGGLSKSLPARWYKDVTLGAILDDLARESGEKLSSEINPAVRKRAVDSFTRRVGQCPIALEQIVELLGAGYQWRVLRDGTVWIGQETWPVVTGPHVVTDESPQHSRIEVAPEQPFLDVGKSFLGRHIVAVQYDYGAALRACVSFADKQSSSIADVFRDLVRRHTAELRFFASYAGKVVTQHEDGTLDIELDTKVVPSPTRVPIRYGVPGIRVLVDPEARVLISYEDGDEHRPIATLWDAAAVKSLEITTTEDVIVNGRAVKLKKEGGRSIAAQGDAVRVMAGSPIPLKFQLVLMGAGLGAGTYDVKWLIDGIPSYNLPGQIVGAFSPNKT